MDTGDIIREAYVNVAYGSVPSVLHVSQYEFGTTVRLHLYNADINNPYIPASNNLYLRGANKAKSFYIPIDTDGTSTVEFVLPKNATLYSGRVTAEITTVVSNMEYSTANFIIEVEPI